MSTKITKSGFILSVVGVGIPLLAWLYPVSSPSNSIVYLNNVILNEHSNITPGTTTKVSGEEFKYLNKSNENLRISELSHDIHASSSGYFKKAYLSISGTGVSIKIKKANSGTPYDGGNISGVAGSKIIYLPKGQKLSVDVTGTGVSITVESEIIEFVNISDSGTGTNIREI